MKIRDGIKTESIATLYWIYENANLYVDMEKTKKVGFICFSKEVEN